MGRFEILQESQFLTEKLPNVDVSYDIAITLIHFPCSIFFKTHFKKSNLLHPCKSSFIFI
jgi:hypothetical protein